MSTGRKTNATISYEVAAEEVASELEALRVALAEHARAQAADARSFGFSGDLHAVLEHVRNATRLLAKPR